MIFAFLVSFLSFYHISVGGELYISELMFLVYLISSLTRLHYLTERLPRKILILGSLWLLSQIITDVYRNSPSENYLRGWAAIVFFMIDFCSIYILVRHQKINVSILILGSSLGVIFGMIVFPTAYSESEPWKFGFGPPVTLLVLLYLSTKDEQIDKMGLLFLAALGFLSIYLNARSLGGMTLMTAALIYIGQRQYSLINEGQSKKPIKLIGMFIGVILAILAIFNLYKFAAEAGYFPENVGERYQLNKTADAGLLGLIAGGRPEVLISSRAVLDSPIIGHGSWAANPVYADMIYEAIATLGLDLDASYLKYAAEASDLIPTHSVIMQSWVWAGLLGALFWLFIFQWVVRNTFVCLMAPHYLQPLVIFSGVNGIWNILFSPFGADQRIYWAIALVLIFVSGEMSQRKNPVQAM